MALGCRLDVNQHLVQNRTLVCVLVVRVLLLNLWFWGGGFFFSLLAGGPLGEVMCVWSDPQLERGWGGGGGGPCECGVCAVRNVLYIIYMSVGHIYGYCRHNSRPVPWCPVDPSAVTTTVRSCLSGPPSQSLLGRGWARVDCLASAHTYTAKCRLRSVASFSACSWSNDAQGWMSLWTPGLYVWLWTMNPHCPRPVWVSSCSAVF